MVQLRYSPRELVADHLDVDLLTHLEPQVADEVLIDPRLELTHPAHLLAHALSARSPELNVPESGLAIGTLLGNGSRSGITGRTLESSVLTSHSSVRRSGGGGGGSSIGLVLEGIEVLERHFGAW